jgi:hypothetical protein
MQYPPKNFQYIQSILNRIYCEAKLLFAVRSGHYRIKRLVEKLTGLAESWRGPSGHIPAILSAKLQ